jgi:DNA polymerase bacteriophage-type
MPPPLHSSNFELNKPRRVIIDIETRGLADLRKVGAARYARDPSTDVWCVAYAVDDQPVELWRPGEPVPVVSIEAAADPDCVFVAHNAGFERAILHHILIPRHGWPPIPLDRWRCTMVACLALALPASLGKVAAVLGLSHQKADDRIMHQMARPRRPRGDEDPAAGPYWYDDTEHLRVLYDYCQQDVETERALFDWLAAVSGGAAALAA